MIEEAQEIVAEEIRELHRTAYFVMMGYQQWFDVRAIAPDCLSPYRLWSQTDEARMEYSTVDMLDNSRVRWLESHSDRPNRWYGLTQHIFGIYPGMSGDTSNVYRLDYLAYPGVLADDSQHPEYDESVHDTLVLYGVYDGLIRRWDIARAQDIFSQFVQSFADRSFATDMRRMNHSIQRLNNGL